MGGGSIEVDGRVETREGLVDSEARMGGSGAGGCDLADALEFGVGLDSIEMGGGSIEVDGRVETHEGLVDSEARGRDAEAGIDWTQADAQVWATVTASHIVLVLLHDHQVSQADRQLPAHSGSYQN
jgi:hypothetical protein